MTSVDWRLLGKVTLCLVAIITAGAILGAVVALANTVHPVLGGVVFFVYLAACAYALAAR